MSKEDLIKHLDEVHSLKIVTRNYRKSSNLAEEDEGEALGDEEAESVKVPKMRKVSDVSADINVDKTLNTTTTNNTISPGSSTAQASGTSIDITTSIRAPNDLNRYKDVGFLLTIARSLGTTRRLAGSYVNAQNAAD